MTAREALAASLQRRTPTWEVAQHVLELALPLPGELRRDLEQLAGERFVELRDAG